MSSTSNDLIPSKKPFYLSNLYCSKACFASSSLCSFSFLAFSKAVIFLLISSIFAFYSALVLVLISSNNCSLRFLYISNLLSYSVPSRFSISPKFSSKCFWIWSLALILESNSSNSLCKSYLFPLVLSLKSSSSCYLWSFFIFNSISLWALNLSLRSSIDSYWLTFVFSRIFSVSYLFSLRTSLIGLFSKGSFFFEDSR